MTAAAGLPDEASEAVRQARVAVYDAEVMAQAAELDALEAERRLSEAREAVAAALAECPWPTRLRYRVKGWFHL